MIDKPHWRWPDWAIFSLYTVWLGVGITMLVLNPVYLKAGSLFTLVGGLVLCYAVPLAFWRPGYLHRGWFPVVVLLTGGSLELFVAYKAHETFDMMFIPTLIVGFLSHRKTIWWTAPVFVVLFPMTELFLAGLVTTGRIINLILNDAFVFGFGLGAQRIWLTHLRTKQLYEENLNAYQLIQQQNKVLEQYARQIEQTTLLEERNRLARELHDTVGHTFTSVIMGMDAVAYLMEQAPDKAAAKLEVLRKVTRTGLDEVRRHIHEIAPPDEGGTLSQQLGHLANEFAVHTGTQVRSQTLGEEIELPKQVQLTLTRCLQESLTNAKRHGQATAVRVTLAYLPDEVRLVVEDDGIGSGDIQTGFGLSAMKERLSALQGTLRVNGEPGKGVTVECAVPVQASR